MTTYDFQNILRILHGIDYHEVRFLGPDAWCKFRDDPAAFMLRANEATAEQIMRVVRARGGKGLVMEDAA